SPANRIVVAERAGQGPTEGRSEPGPHTTKFLRPADALDSADRPDAPRKAAIDPNSPGRAGPARGRLDLEEMARGIDDREKPVDVEPRQRRDALVQGATSPRL